MEGSRDALLRVQLQACTTLAVQDGPGVRDEGRVAKGGQGDDSSNWRRGEEEVSSAQALEGGVQRRGGLADDAWPIRWGRKEDDEDVDDN